MQWSIALYLSEWLSPKRPQITIIGKDVNSREHLYTAGRNVNWSLTVEQHEGLSKNWR